MDKILVTGATGELGRQSVEFLLERIPADRIVALARSPAKAADLEALGVEVRQGDYADPASLERAFRGVDRMLMVSTVMFTDTIAHHRNVVAAARAAGVRHVVYTGIQRREGSGVVIDMVSDTERATEEALAASGLGWTILRNSLYADTLPLIFGPGVLKDGVRAPAGGALAALGTRRDFAEAAAVVLTTEGHEGRIYTLGASTPATFSDMATALGRLAGETLPYVPVDRATFVAERTADGLPPAAADFLAQWVEAVAAGEFSEVTGDLECLLGRPPMTPIAYLETVFGAPARSV